MNLFLQQRKNTKAKKQKKYSNNKKDDAFKLRLVIESTTRTCAMSFSCNGFFCSCSFSFIFFSDFCVCVFSHYFYRQLYLHIYSDLMPRDSYFIYAFFSLASNIFLLFFVHLQFNSVIPCIYVYV